MTFTPVAPWPVLLVVAVVLLAACVAAGARRDRWRWSMRALMVLAAVAVAAQPAVGSTPGRAQLSNLDIVVAVDRSPSVNATDWNGSATRLAGVRRDVGELVSSLDGARVAVVTFASKADEVLPFSTDPSAIDTLLSVTEPEDDQNSSGSTLSRPVTLLHKVLAADAKEHPTRQRLLVLLSDGEQTVSRPPGSFASLHPYLSGGAVWGYGTTRGAHIVEYDPDNPNSHQLVANGDTGATAVSHYDPATLRTAARQLGVPFHHRTRPGDVRSDVHLPTLRAAAGTSATRTGRQLYWIPALVLAALALGEAAMLVTSAAPVSRPGLRRSA